MLNVLRNTLSHETVILDGFLCRFQRGLNTLITSIGILTFFKNCFLFTPKLRSINNCSEHEVIFLSTYNFKTYSK